ncbi:MAG: TGS domain-containing protein [Thermoplasmatota archaeon]
MKRDSTIEDVCRKLHSDCREKFRYARIWGPTAKFPKQQAGMDHELKEGDTVRIITD